MKIQNNNAFVLHMPEIPGNTGSIGRTALALNMRLILIGPYGFSLDEKSVRRAGLDYWKNVDLTEYHSFEEYLTQEAVVQDQLYFFSKNGKNNFLESSQIKNSHFIFGSETKGLPKTILEKYIDQTYSLPMDTKLVRSLNLANIATTVAYLALKN